MTVALVAAMAAASLGIALFWEAPAPTPGTHVVRVEGPDELIWQGVVEHSPGTALSALEAAADAGNFALRIVNHPGIAPCGQYVEAIAGVRAEGQAGWIFEVEHGNGDVERPSVGACAHALQPGDVVVWRWSNEPSGA